MIVDPENWFLIILAIAWITGAILQDLRRREVDNVWNFSLVIFALAYRAIASTYSGNYWLLLNGVFGLIIFFILGNVFYYSRLFAGGDAKLLIALGPIMPLSFNWIVNLKLFGLFIAGFLVTGSIYAIIWALFLVFGNFKRFSKEFLRQWKKNRKIFWIAIIVTLFYSLFIFVINEVNFLIMGIVILLFPVLFVFAKAVEESCMIVKLSPGKITEGDWLYKDIIVGRKKIESNWEGVSKRELGLIRSKAKGKILVKQGIPFTPSFLFGFLLMLYIVWKFGWLF